VSALNQTEKINELILGILKELHFRVCLLESDEEGQDDGNGTKKLLDKLDKLMPRHVSAAAVSANEKVGKV